MSCSLFDFVDLEAESPLHHIKLWKELSLFIRQCTHSQRTDLFYSYFELAEQIVVELEQPQQWLFYKSVLHNLIETIEDPTIPAHWRRLCFDSIHRPLLCLKRLVANYPHSDLKVFELRHLYISVNSQLNIAFARTPF